MNAHIDTLTEWWESADVEGIVRAGDTIIKKGRAGYDIYTAWSHEDGEDVTMWKYEQDPPVADYRILSRAPKPKPAWHDAVAVVIARIERREVYAKIPGRETWKNTATGHEISTHMIEHYDPVPLIEARVTDEMVGRVGDMLGAYYGAAGDKIILDVLHAALGLDPDTEENA